MANIDSIKLPDSSEYDLQVKVTGAINGNVAVMDGNGNVADSGVNLANEIATRNVMGAKNLLPNKLIPHTEVINDVTITVNDDGSITLNGTASAQVNFEVLDFGTSFISDDELHFSGNILSGCTNGGNDFYLFIGLSNDGTTISSWLYNRDGDDIIPASPYFGRMYLRVENGAAVNNVTVKPMIRYALDSNNTYEPFAQSNRELTIRKADSDNVAPTEDGATASKAYAVGEHFIRGGKYCECISAIASGGTFALNTNYIESTVAKGTVFTRTYSNITISGGLFGTGLSCNDYAFLSCQIVNPGMDYIIIPRSSAHTQQWFGNVYDNNLSIITGDITGVTVKATFLKL